MRSNHHLAPAPHAPAQVLLALYPFLWFQLYAFLFKQRRKKLGGGPRPKAA